MSTVGNSSTSFDPTQGVNYATVSGGVLTLPQANELWKPTIISPTSSKATNVSLGGIFVTKFAALCVISTIALVTTLFSPIPYLSVKFAIFLVLFFGGFTGELLYARKGKKDGQ